MMQAETAFDADHFVRFGDVYDAIQACDQLDMLLARLKRQQVLPPEPCTESREQVATIRRRLENHISSHDLMPKGPRLP